VQGFPSFTIPCRCGRITGQSFKADDTGSLNIPKSVAYAEQFTGMTFDPSTQDRLFFSKLSDWSYEREWRVLTALSACRRSSDGKLYLRDVDRFHPKGVICGWRASADDISLLGEELKRLNPDAKLISASFDGGGRVNLNPSLK
jgi:hypothetical protein